MHFLDQHNRKLFPTPPLHILLLFKKILTFLLVKTVAFIVVLNLGLSTIEHLILGYLNHTCNYRLCLGLFLDSHSIPLIM